jgi:hypothetical protein
MGKVILKAKNLHWLGESETERDLCLHGFVDLSIGGKSLSDENSGEWTVCVASYNLLKTVNNNYTKSTFNSQLIPCCGHSKYCDMGESIFITGCSNGVDWNITHKDRKIIHSFDDGEEIETSHSEWAKAVVEFSDDVMDFYEQSSERVPSDEHEKEALRRFLAEWKQLMVVIVLG